MAKPTPDEFYDAAAQADVVALSVTLNYDTETAISLADRFVNESHFFLLESATAGPGGIARYSYLGFDPLWQFACKDARLRFGWVDRPCEQDLKSRNPLRVMEEEWTKLSMAAVPSSQRLVDGVDVCGMGGAVGFVSYDAGKLIEPAIGGGPDGRLELPQIYKFLPRNFCVLDQLSRKLTVVRFVRTAGDLTRGVASSLLDSEWRALSALQQRVSRPHIPPALQTEKGLPNYDACSASFPEPAFLESVDRCLEEIRSGEVYQIQIGNRLSCESAARPFDVFRHLRILNPSPYMVFFKLEDHHIICASPEMMVNVVDREVRHRPIAGTRKRTWQTERDRQMKQELLTDEKERAEDVMLVDLSRNDIGRIAAPGSVTVDELMVVEEYSHVFHLVSQVTAQLRPEVSAFEALSASFPNGTVSGAPKIRAMQLIAEIEPCGREFYAGSLGMFDFSGQLRSTILIRTIYMAHGHAHTQASAGIVYDSIPEREWDETRNKMAACLIAMQHTH